MTKYTGIDYGRHGQSNRYLENGIHYSVISQHSISLTVSRCPTSRPKLQINELFAALKSLPDASEEERLALVEILDNEGFGGAEDDIKDHESALLLAQAKLAWYRNVRNVRH